MRFSFANVSQGNYHSLIEALIVFRFQLGAKFRFCMRIEKCSLKIILKD